MGPQVFTRNMRSWDVPVPPPRFPDSMSPTLCLEQVADVPSTQVADLELFLEPLHLTGRQGEGPVNVRPDGVATLHGFFHQSGSEQPARDGENVLLCRGQSVQTAAGRIELDVDHFVRSKRDLAAGRHGLVITTKNSVLVGEDRHSGRVEWPQRYGLAHQPNDFGE